MSALTGPDLRVRPLQGRQVLRLRSVGGEHKKRALAHGYSCRTPAGFGKTGREEGDRSKRGHASQCLRLFVTPPPRAWQGAIRGAAAPTTASTPFGFFENGKKGCSLEYSDVANAGSCVRRITARLGVRLAAVPDNASLAVVRVFPTLEPLPTLSINRYSSCNGIESANWTTSRRRP